MSFFTKIKGNHQTSSFRKTLNYCHCEPSEAIFSQTDYVLKNNNRVFQSQSNWSDMFNSLLPNSFNKPGN